LVGQEFFEEDESMNPTNLGNITRHLMQQHFHLSDLELLELYFKEEKKHVPNFSVPYRYEKESVPSTDLYSFAFLSSESDDDFPKWVEEWNDKTRDKQNEFSKLGLFGEDVML